MKKCDYCQDPIYKWQEKVKVSGKTYHKGCYEIKQQLSTTKG